MLDLKTIESQKYERKMAIFSPVKSLEFIHAMFKPHCDIAGTKLEFKTVSIQSLDGSLLHNHTEELMEHQELPEQLEGDNLRLQQILINLTKNAFKFAQGGLVRIYMAYSRSEELLRVHVKDNGKGIKQEDIEKLFTMFGKLKRTADQNSEGIGMGLMICQNLVR